MVSYNSIGLLVELEQVDPTPIEKTADRTDAVIVSILRVVSSDEGIEYLVTVRSSKWSCGGPDSCLECEGESLQLVGTTTSARRTSGASTRIRTDVSHLTHIMSVQLLLEGVNTRLRARNGAYHNVAVDGFDDKVVDALDAIIAILFVRRPGTTGRIWN